MIDIDESMYTPIGNLQLGNFSREWVIFNNGLFGKRPTLIKYIGGNQKGSKGLEFLNDQNFNIPFIALNPLIAEIISKTGDPNAQVAEYFLARQNNEIFICSPSFKEDDEEIIEGSDLLKSQHQALRRINPEDVIIMVSDIIEQLQIRKIPNELIDKIVMQFLKDCFKNAYMEMFDPHNTNFGILYSGIGVARIAPLYDLDLGLNVPYIYSPDIESHVLEDIVNIMKKIKSPNFLPNYISTIGKKYTWFDCWVKGFVNNIRDIDLGKILLEEKQIELKPEQISHYMDFIKSQNAIIDQYFLRVSGQR